MRVITNYPVAYDSPDHIYPWGTSRDNTTDHGFIYEIENYFQNKKIKMLDIGCSGGQLVIDFESRGHRAIGIEGSDFSLKTKRANWPSYYNKNLFTCDATKPYRIVDEDENDVIFDLVTGWEVLEHIKEDDFDIFFNNIKNHMNENSIFCASISPVEDIQIINPGIIQGLQKEQFITRENYNYIMSILPEDNKQLEDSDSNKFIVNILHQTVYNEDYWVNNILSKHFNVSKLPFSNKVRYGDSFHVLLKIS